MTFPSPTFQNHTILGALTVAGVPVPGPPPAPSYVDVTSPTYTTIPTDRFIAVNSIVPVTVTLGAAPPLGAVQTVADVGANAATANISVQALSGTINGFANVLMTQARMVMSFTFTSAGWIIG